ncbi:MAG TPA: methyltransferase domain-containing protein [Castellaniella sp.]|jgi:ubiquinone/menaquinone biosynthesis C-methylase UbiE|nr:methyltransferase domain-containing protein [Castellaniella sp.]
MSQPSGWQLSGSASEAYERYIVQAFMQGWTHALLDVATLAAGARVLDVACGTGVVARQAATRVGKQGHVVGVDLNAGMLAMARMLAQSSGASIEWKEGNVTALPFPEASFDVVLCQQGLQFFPDKPAALRDMRRVLMPTGHLVLSVWRQISHCPWQRAVADALERHVSMDAALGIRGAFALGDREELRALVRAAGFRTIRVRIDSQMIRYPSLDEFLPGYLSATPVAGIVAQLDQPTRAAILQEVKTSLEPYVDDDGLAAPIEAHALVANQ